VTNERWHDSDGYLLDVDAWGTLAFRRTIIYPADAAAGVVEALTLHEGRLFALVEDGSDGLSGRQWVVDQDSGAAWRIDVFAYGGGGSVMPLGDTLLVASAAIHPDNHASLAAISASGDLGPLVTLSQRAVAYGMRMTTTPRGFAIVWNEGDPGEMLESMLQVFECCR
jgi:hypothetical protein